MPRTAPRHRVGKLKIALAASGGGHVWELLDLESAWGGHDAFFISEDTALSRSISEKHRTLFVPHFGLGQAKLGAWGRMLASAVRNCLISARHMLRERPDVVVTTGAGAVFFTVFWARLLGSKVVTIETFARFETPSVFGRLTAPIATNKVIQSRALAPHWPDAQVFDPLRLLNGPRPVKKNLLFATVGAVLPFDRLVAMVAELKAHGDITEEVVIQCGVGGHRPEGVESSETLSFDRMQTVLRDADIVVCHGGTGSLITALRQGCRVIAVPRLFSKREVYDDHQEEIVNAFVARGLILRADTLDDLADALRAARGRAPVMATSEPAELTTYLTERFALWRRAS
jgi:UDP-N-acetylglucosamine--N-acetylmuramyl-(pentapeptide) pyrophosphoryl-undecaprenol N-acetylglucosamine transferase